MAKRKIIEKKAVTVNLPVVNVPQPLQGFVNFVREQGVVGLAVALILGVAAKSVIDSIVANIFNPIVGVLTGGVDLADKTICLTKIEGVCSSRLSYGKVISDIISFLIVALVVYMVVHGLKLDRLDKKKE